MWYQWFKPSSSTKLRYQCQTPTSISTLLQNVQREVNLQNKHTIKASWASIRKSFCSTWAITGSGEIHTVTQQQSLDCAKLWVAAPEACDREAPESRARPDAAERPGEGQQGSGRLRRRAIFSSTIFIAKIKLRLSLSDQGMRARGFGADATSLSARSGAHVAKINSTILELVNEIFMTE